MIGDLNHRCSICQQIAKSAFLVTTTPKLDDGTPLYDIACTNCGEYRIASSREESMAKQSDAHRSGLVRLIKTANGRGNRYCLNDGREIELDPSQAIGLTLPPSQKQEQHLAE